MYGTGWRRDRTDEQREQTASTFEGEKGVALQYTSINYKLDVRLGLPNRSISNNSVCIGG